VFHLCLCGFNEFWTDVLFDSGCQIIDSEMTETATALAGH